MSHAYPLSWPDGWPRMKPYQRTRAKFGKREGYGTAFRPFREVTVNDGVMRVRKALAIFGVVEGDCIISTNVPTRLDGFPRSDARAPDDPGVAVYWERLGEKGTKVMAIDRYDRVADNLAAIAATLDAMRAIERHGGAQILDRAFTGFVALPGPGQIARSWRDVLELNGEQTIDRARDNYRRLAGIRHPDKGGSNDAMAELNLAWEQAQAALA